MNWSDCLDIAPECKMEATVSLFKKAVLLTTEPTAPMDFFFYSVIYVVEKRLVSTQ